MMKKRDAQGTIGFHRAKRTQAMRDARRFCHLAQTYVAAARWHNHRAVWLKRTHNEILQGKFGFSYEEGDHE